MKYTLTSIFAIDIESFLDFRVAQGYAVESVAKKYLRRFDKYCTEYPPESDLLTKGLVDSWLSYEQEQKYVDLSGRASAMRHFAKYLKSIQKEAYIIPTSYYRVKSSFVPYILSRKELKAFFEATDDITAWHCGDKFAPAVAPVIFRLMYTSGLRPSEAMRLKDTDLNLTNGEILIRVNKSMKERIIVVSDDMLRLLSEYVIQRSTLFVRTSYFFPRIDGSQYTARHLEDLCYRCWKLANPQISPDRLPHLRPYDFRHSFASSVLQKWINEGRNLFTMLPYLRTYMGHEHFTDTAYYIHILPERLISSPGVDWDRLDSSIPEVAIWD